MEPCSPGACSPGALQPKSLIAPELKTSITLQHEALWIHVHSADAVKVILLTDVRGAAGWCCRVVLVW